MSVQVFFLYPRRKGEPRDFMRSEIAGMLRLPECAERPEHEGNNGRVETRSQDVKQILVVYRSADLPAYRFKGELHGGQGNLLGE